MIFRLKPLSATNEKPPGVPGRGATVFVSTRQSGASADGRHPLFLHTECRNARGMPMPRTIRYFRQKREGRLHRTKIRVLLAPTLRVGEPVPTGTFLGHWLRINPSEAWRHMRRVLAEDGYVTELRGKGRSRRLYVVEIPALQVAA